MRGAWAAVALLVLALARPAYAGVRHFWSHGPRAPRREGGGFARRERPLRARRARATPTRRARDDRNAQQLPARKEPFPFLPPLDQPPSRNTNKPLTRRPQHNQNPTIKIQNKKQSLAEGRPCTTGPDCRSFICLNGRCAGAGNACTATAATRAECMDSVFVKASCTKGKYDRILTTLDMFAAPMARGPAREIACFNATTPGLEVARCVSVSDGAIGRYGLQCGAVMVRGLSDGDPPPVRQSSGAGGAAAAGGLAAAIGAAVVAAVGLMV